MTESIAASPTCPWWLLFTFDNPLRHLAHDPNKILTPYVQPGYTCLDIGCGKGYFTLALAELAGATGRVIAADLQPEMLDGLRRRAAHAHLLDRIEFVHSSHERIGIGQELDFALAFWMVHEVRHRQAFLQEVYDALKPAGHLLIVEPRIHVSGKAFSNTVDLAENLGFQITAQPHVWGSRSVLLKKSRNGKEENHVTLIGT